MGAYFVLYPQSRVLTLIPWIFIQIVELPAIVLLGFWFLMQLFSAGAIAVTTQRRQAAWRSPRTWSDFVAGMGGVFVFKKRIARPVGPGTQYY